MNIATRFGKNDSDSNFQSIGSFDISTLKPTEFIALLSLPEGDEEKFIEQTGYDQNMALVKIAELQDIVHERSDQIYNLERNYPVPNAYEALEKSRRNCATVLLNKLSLLTTNLLSRNLLLLKIESLSNATLLYPKLLVKCLPYSFPDNVNELSDSMSTVKI